MTRYDLSVLSFTEKRFTRSNWHKLEGQSGLGLYTPSEKLPVTLPNKPFKWYRRKSWRRPVLTEMSGSGLSRVRWRTFVNGLCFQWKQGTEEEGKENHMFSILENISLYMVLWCCDAKKIQTMFLKSTSSQTLCPLFWYHWLFLCVSGAVNRGAEDGYLIKMPEDLT